MPQRKLDDWLRTYLDFTENTECPTSFNFWVGVWTIAGALRRRVWLDMGHFQWYPNFYLFLVAPPGIVSKSTTLSIGTKLLEQVPGIKFGPEAMTWQALTQALAGSLEEVPIEVEGKPTLFYPMSCLSIAAGELGTLIDPSHRELIDALVSLWDGKTGAWEKWTKASGSDKIINPWLNIASCTTPAWLALNFPEDMIGGGFTSRCVFVYAEKKRQLIAYPYLLKHADNAEVEKSLVHDLELISTLRGEIKLSPAALAWGQQWYEEHYNNPPKDMDGSRFGGYLARKQTHIHKVAMVLSVSVRSSLIIEKEDLEKASILVNSLEPQMKKVFESIGVEGSGKYLHMILMILQVAKKISRTTLFQKVCTKMSIDEFDAAIGAGARGKLFTVYANGTDQYIVLPEDATKGAPLVVPYVTPR
jgi:hypothetical protein